MIHRTHRFILIAALLILVGAGGAWATGHEQEATRESGEQAPVAKPQTHCPIMGGDIDKTVYVDHEGYRVYFCCPGCIPTFEEDPAAAIERLHSQGIMLEATPKPQTMCPVMESPIEKTYFVDHEGQRIYFCCKPCIDKFKEDPEKYLGILEDAGVTLEPTPRGEQAES